MVEAIRQALEAVPEVRLAVLFGSTARGTARRGSDLDIGVSLADCPADPYGNALAVSLERLTGRTVDLILLDSAPPLLRFEISRDGLLLVEREAHAWSTFRAHAMIDWWDWAPTARMVHRIAVERLREKVAHGTS